MQILRLQAKVLEAWVEGEENVSWKLELPQPLGFKPGQFVMVNLDGVGAKAMSMASSPAKPYLELSAEMSESPYKQKWRAVKPGDSVGIIGPYGIFTLSEAEPKLAFIAGGIGITPFKSMMEYVADRQLSNDAVLLYSNKKPELIAYKKELDALCKAHPNLRTIYTITRPEESTQLWGGLKGRINEEFVRAHVPDWNERLWYVCAGPAMVDAMVQMLESMGLERKRVKREAFAGLH